MDVELKEIMDEIMNSMHQISWWFMELEKKELAGTKIDKKDVLDNPAINKLFINNQENYRKLQARLAKKVSEVKEKYVESSSLKTQDEVQAKIIKALENYLTESYVNLRLVPFRYGSERMLLNSIYKTTPFEEIMISEYTLQELNLEQIDKRVKSMKSEKLSFKDKAEVLQTVSRKWFYKNYVFETIDKYISECKESKEELSEQLYKFELEKLISQKYVQYYSCLNHKYNDFIQYNDIGKLGTVQAYASEGIVNVALNMSEFEVESNLNQNQETLKEAFDEYIKDLTSIFRRIKIVKRNNNRALLDMDDDDDREI